jgi:hypothetical protein
VVCLETFGWELSCSTDIGFVGLQYNLMNEKF